ncbi:TonB-dependent receptor [Flavobacterium sp. KMS]|uniref:TonB-dependent receptor n=1 Tax=Flavobacterium sp. KMS TaxID=1566023 RepID=UPI0005802727|nr:TonB-dependent receptor [Flavobacterium sp. KMS]KIC00133.1 TonB-dependent receptor [Flavobacterium sp. KMS]
MKYLNQQITKILFIVVLFFFAITAVSAQESGNIKGKVLTNDNKPAEGVSISIKGVNKATIADNDGVFEIKKVPVGTQTLIITLVGYNDVEQEVTVAAGETITTNVQLTLSNTELNQVVVLSNKSAFKTNRVSSSLRLQSAIIEIPQNIQVITGKLIQDQQIYDMLEGVTRNVSGVTRVEHWDTYANIMMRGSQVAAFRNGMNVSTDWGPLTEDMSMVERIEFVKGPAGFMMANGNPSGFYNVVTKKPSGRTKGEMNLTLGSFDMYRGTLDLDGKLSKDGKLLYRINVMGQMKESHRDYDYNNRYSIAPVLKYLVDDKTSITLEYTQQFSQVNIIGSNYVFSNKQFAELPRSFTTGEPNFDPTNMNDKSILAILEHKLDQNWKFTAQGAYFNYKQEGMSMWPAWNAFDPDPSLGVKSGILHRKVSIWDVLGITKTGQMFVNGEVKTGPINHKILGGLDMSDKLYYHDWSQSADLNGYDADGNIVPFDIYNPIHGNVPADKMPKFDRSKDIRERGVQYQNGYTGFYVQDELGMFEDKLRVTVAGRYTTLKTSTAYTGSFKDSKFTPRLGISYSIDKNTAAYFVRDEAFTENYGTDWQGNSFDPQTGTNIELGLKRDWLNGKWNSVISAYQITKNNVLTADPEHSTSAKQYSRQSGQQKVKGFDLDIRGQIIRNVDVVINYAFTQAKVTQDSDPALVGTQVPGTSKHIQNTWINYKMDHGALNGFGLSLGYQYQIDRSPWFVSNSSQQNLPDYFRLDGGVTYQKGKISFNVIVNNILNKYLYSGGIYNGYYDWQTEAGTNARLTVAYKF